MSTHSSPDRPQPASAEGAAVFLHDGDTWRLGEDRPTPLRDADRDAVFEALIPVYQEAFGDRPWYERSQCPEDCTVNRKYCRHYPGQFCEFGGATPEKEAFPADELRRQFTELYRDGALFMAEYLDDERGAPVLGAVMWMTDATRLGNARYEDRPEMREWLIARFGDREFIYRDEVFADRSRRPSGNLRNYHQVIDAAIERFACRTLVGRSINPRLIGKLHGIFGDRFTLFAPHVPPRGAGEPLAPHVTETVRETVPDDRYLTLIEA